MGRGKGKGDHLRATRCFIFIRGCLQEEVRDWTRRRRDGAPLRVPFRDGMLICIPILGCCRTEILEPVLSPPPLLTFL